MISAIYDRRSIRKFREKPISKEDLTEIIESGIKAPSSKNRQPWKFIVVQGAEKEEMLKAFREGIASEMTPEEHIYEICNVQSISAAIQNMLLTATEKGIGSLWICDIYFAYAELSEWLHCEGQLLAAVAFGYADECPQERPRKAFEDVVVWRG